MSHRIQINAIVPDEHYEAARQIVAELVATYTAVEGVEIITNVPGLTNTDGR